MSIRITNTTIIPTMRFHYLTVWRYKPVSNPKFKVSEIDSFLEWIDIMIDIERSSYYDH